MTRTASVHTVAPPTTQELVERARQIAPVLRKNAPAGDANRRVEEESIDAMAKAGVMKICTPKRYGGWEMNTRAMLDVSAAIGEAERIWRAIAASSRCGLSAQTAAKALAVDRLMPA